MPRRSYSDDERQAALEAYMTQGTTAAAHTTGIAKGTIAAWAHRAGLQTVCTEEMRAATEAIRAGGEARKAILAEKLLQIAEAGADRELALIDDAKLRDVVGSRTRAVHDMQLMTGEATSRTEHKGASVDDEVARLAEELALSGAA